jgi:hypothetical protein
VTDVRDPSGHPRRQPSDGVPSRQPGGVLPAQQATADVPVSDPGPDQASGFGGGPRARGPELPGRGATLPTRVYDLPVRSPGPAREPEPAVRAPEPAVREPEGPSRGPELTGRGPELPAGGPEPAARRMAGVPPRGSDRGGGAFPMRQPSFRPPQSGGRHRRAVPASLPQSAPALVLGVPGRDTDLAAGPVAELTAVLRVDNPAVEVRAARIDGSDPDDPSDLRAVLNEAAERRPDGPCAVVIPLIATVNPPVVHRLRDAVAASGTNSIISGFVNSNAMIAEVLHIRLAEAGLARADRVRLFSIVTAADGVLIATVGGPDAASAANVTSVLLAARLALPVITASADNPRSIHDGAMRLKEMGVGRLAIAPCFIGPEATRNDLDALSIGAEVAAPIGAHSNIAKLAALTYGHAISQLDLPFQEQQTRGAHE